VSEPRVVALDDVLTRVKRPVKLQPDESYRTLGVRWYGAGCFLKDAQLGSKIAAPALFEVEQDDIVYSRLFAWKGSFGVVKPEHAGAMASNEFPTYRASDALLPEYFALWASRPEIWDEAGDASTGTTANSRNRLGEDDFLALQLQLPSVDEQAQIVQAVAVIDKALQTVRAEAEAARMLMQAARAEIWADLDEAEAGRTLADLTKVTSGGTPSRQKPEYFGGDIPWVKTSEVAFCEISRTEETITDAGLKNSSAKLFPADTVLVAMYGRGTVGRSALITRSMATNQACAAILPCDEMRPRFLFHWLWSHYHDLIDMAEGTTNLTNISKQIVDALVVPVPPLGRQDEIVERFDALLDAAEAADAEAKSYADVRAAMVDELVTGRRSLPRSGPILV
jgi:type I restriction enzyme S subunit